MAKWTPDKPDGSVKPSADTRRGPREGGRRFGTAPRAGAGRGAVGTLGRDIHGKAGRVRPDIEASPGALAAGQLMKREAPIFEGMEGIVGLDRFDRVFQACGPHTSGDVLFDPNHPETSLGGENDILIPGEDMRIAVYEADGTLITRTTIPAYTAMGASGFLSKGRKVRVIALDAGDSLWKLEGPLATLDMPNDISLVLRANLLRARAAELAALNRDISDGDLPTNRPMVGGSVEPERVQAIFTKLGLQPQLIASDYVEPVGGNMYYLASGRLSVHDSSGKVLGAVDGPQFVQEVVGVGGQATARLKVMPGARGCYVPLRVLMEQGRTNDAAPLLILAEEAFESRMAEGNRAVSAGQPQRRMPDLRGWAKGVLARWRGGG